MRCQVPIASHINKPAAYIDFSGALDTAVGKCISAGGISGYEPETIAAAAALVDHFEVVEFADIGANIGIYSVVLKAIFGTRLGVTAFEPLPSLSRIARQLAHQNNLDIKVREEAIADSQGSATFYVSAKSDSSNSLNPRFRKAKEQIQVRLNTLDALLDEGLSPGFLKIDTESTEPDVLRGGELLISSQRPWIICEILHGRTERQVSDFARRMDYFTYHLDGRHNLEVAELVGDPTYKHRDWLLAPIKLTESFGNVYADWLAAFGRDTNGRA